METRIFQRRIRVSLGTLLDQVEEAALRIFQEEGARLASQNVYWTTWDAERRKSRLMVRGCTSRSSTSVEAVSDSDIGERIQNIREAIKRLDI